MDQPTAEEALKALEPLVGEWTLEAPNRIAIMGCDAANGTYYQLYSDDRGVCRVLDRLRPDLPAGQIAKTGPPYP